MRFNPPPGWPRPPSGWSPPVGWKPDPSWPEPPIGWQLWLPDNLDAHSAAHQPIRGSAPVVPAPEQVLADPGPTARAAMPSHGSSADRASPGEIARLTTSTFERHANPATAVAVAASPGSSTENGALLARIAELEAALARAKASTEGSLIELDDQLVLQEVGIYRYHHPLEDAAAYKEQLRIVEGKMDEIIKAGRAVLAADMFTFSGSLAKGRKMVADLSKLMLRAYNAEADNCVRSLRSGNITTAKKRLQSAVTAIEKLGALMEMRVNPEYHAVRVQELELTADFQMKVQEERERARDERELLREQRRAEQELAAERERLEKERTHYQSALAVLRAKGDDAAATELVDRLAEIDQAIADNDYRIANIRAGYVYVISNIGAFGQNIVKIGMTRRLEPLDRVRELGDASVPFPYDVHTLYFSSDAIALENELHKAFADRRVNFVNERREFFFVTPAEVREILQEKTGGLLEFTEQPEAAQYFQSRSRWPQF